LLQRLCFLDRVGGEGLDMHRTDDLERIPPFLEIFLDQVGAADGGILPTRAGLFEMRVDAGPEVPQVDMRIDDLQLGHGAPQSSRNTSSTGSVTGRLSG